MAVPTIASVTPSTGPTGGRTLVEIIGTNFQLPPAAAATGKTTAPNPSVRVLFGGKPATRVRVISATRLQCLTPITPKVPTDAADASGAVNVMVENIDQNGVTVPGETVSAANAYTYAMPKLTAETTLTRLTRAFIVELRRQVVNNVELARHVDFDPATGDNMSFIEVAGLPALVLIGPELRYNGVHGNDSVQPVTISGSTGSVHYAPRVRDLVFEVMGITDSVVARSNLIELFEGFMQRNPWIYLDRDESNPAAGQNRYELNYVFGEDPRAGARSVNSNVVTWTTRVYLQAVQVEGIAGFADSDVIEQDATVDQVVLSSQRIAEDL
jgi:hypothetical protein